MFPKILIRRRDTLLNRVRLAAIVLLSTAPVLAQAPIDPTAEAATSRSPQAQPVAPVAPVKAGPAGTPLGSPPAPTRQPTVEPATSPPAPPAGPEAPIVPPPTSPEIPPFEPPPFDAPLPSSDLPFPDAPLPGDATPFDDPATPFPDLPGPGGSDDRSAFQARANQVAGSAAREAAVALDGTGAGVGGGFGGLGGGGFGGGDVRLDALVRELSDHLRNEGPQIPQVPQPVWPGDSEFPPMAEEWRSSNEPDFELPPAPFEPPPT